MILAEEITREVVFTDFNCADDSRIEVVVSQDGGSPFCNIRMPAYPDASFCGADDIRYPEVLRSYAQCLLMAADEMERMKT